MSDSCTHDCSTCSSDCGGSNEVLKEPLHPDASVGRVYAVAGGKGGVGRSSVAALLASRLQKQGYSAAVFDADITGPSIPTAFGVTTRAVTDDRGIFPMETDSGVQIMSVNLIIPNPTDPVLARGTLVENTIKKFWSDVIWEDVDFMFIDLPAGTGEIPIAVLRHLPIDGMIIVTGPQAVTGMITEKTAKMAKALNIPVAALVENMAYYKDEDTGKEVNIFGESKLNDLAAKIGTSLTARLPIDPHLCDSFDRGEIETYETDALDEIINRII